MMLLESKLKLKCIALLLHLLFRLLLHKPHLLLAMIRQETLPQLNAEQRSTELCHSDQREREILNESNCDIDELEILMEMECLNNIRQTHAENANLSNDM